MRACKLTDDLPTARSPGPIGSNRLWMRLTFPQPMYEALRDLSQDFMFPGLEQVPTNTVALLETNPNSSNHFW